MDAKKKETNLYYKINVDFFVELDIHFKEFFFHIEGEMDPFS